MGNKAAAAGLVPAKERSKLRRGTIECAI